MYSMKNGILYENGRPVFCVGLSYYPSYHECKVPVPEDGDRVGEMKKDLRRMKEAGFNLVRAASIGDVRRVNGEVEIHTEFIERLLDEADRVDIASMMRLQGYSMNLSGYDDFYMINSRGEQMDKTRWYDFLQNSMYHPGILRDNDDGTRAYIADTGGEMLVLDTSGAFAAIDRAAHEHEAARRVLESEKGPILLSPFVLAELDYMLLSRIGPRAELEYLREVTDGVYDLMPMTRPEVVEAVDVISRYADMWVGLTDASVAVLAARHRTTRVLTLDQRHFRATKPLWGDAFTVLPADAN